MTSLKDRLLEAQTRWVIEQLTGPALPELVARDVSDLLAAGERVTVAEVVDPELLKQVVRTVAERVPASAAASTVTGVAAEVIHSGPAQSYTLTDVIDRENVERLTDEVLGSLDLVEAFLDDLARSPMVAASASRFVTHMVTDVISANRAMAEKIPGIGGLVSVGANMTGKVIGAADRQIEAVVGNTAAKGATYAMRRLNKVLIETLKNPATREAVLEAFDMYSEQPVIKVHKVAEVDDVRRIAGLIQDIVIAGAPTEPVLALADALVDGFLATYGEHPVTTLFDDLDLSRDELTEHATAAADRLLGAAHEAGVLEPLVRDRLAPFWASTEVAALLDEA